MPNREHDSYVNDAINLPAEPSKDDLLDHIEKHFTDEFSDAVLAFFISLENRLPSKLRTGYSVWFGAQGDSAEVVTIVFYLTFPIGRPFTTTELEIFKELREAFLEEVASLTPAKLEAELELFIASANAKGVELELEVQKTIEKHDLTPIAGIALHTT